MPKLWAITTYFNPAGYGSRYYNYQVFRARLQVPLVTVELSFDGRFALREGDADTLVQVTDGDVLWQKERLANVGLEALPDECEFVALFDCDIVIPDGGWVARVESVLEQAAFAQPFHRLYFLLPYRTPESAGQTTFHSHRSALHLAGSANRRALKGSPGHVWVFRREVLEAGFYDGAIMGSGDRLMASAALGLAAQPADLMQMRGAYREHYLAWAARFREQTGGRIGYVGTGKAYALWHGPMQARGYEHRFRCLNDAQFDPAADVKLGPGGAWQWASDKPQLHRRAREYFQSRNEDGVVSDASGGRAVMEVG